MRLGQWEVFRKCGWRRGWHGVLGVRGGFSVREDGNGRTGMTGRNGGSRTACVVIEGDLLEQKDRSTWLTDLVVIQVNGISQLGIQFACKNLQLDWVCVLHREY